MFCPSHFELINSICPRQWKSGGSRYSLLVIMWPDFKQKTDFVASHNCEDIVTKFGNLCRKKITKFNLGKSLRQSALRVFGGLPPENTIPLLEWEPDRVRFSVRVIVWCHLEQKLFPRCMLDRDLNHFKTLYNSIHISFLRHFQIYRGNPDW